MRHDRPSSEVVLVVVVVVGKRKKKKKTLKSGKSDVKKDYYSMSCYSRLRTDWS